MAEIISATLTLIYVTGKYFETRDQLYPINAKPKFLNNAELGSAALPIILDNLSQLKDESLLKIVRQLDFFYENDLVPREDFIKLTKRLVREACYVPNISRRIPRIKFGKTNIHLPAIAYNGLYLKRNIITDVINHTMEKMMTLVTKLLKAGMNYFEISWTDWDLDIHLLKALCAVLEQNIVPRRNKIILHVKLPPKRSPTQLERTLNQILHHAKSLEYIDLFSFNLSANTGNGIGGNNDRNEANWIFNAVQERRSCFDVIQKFQKEEKIRYIGFSSRGTTESIMKLIQTEQFDFVSLFYHFLGDTIGGHEYYSNLTCVKKALELDMGIISLNPFERGGMLHNATDSCILSIGEKVSPLSYASISCWQKGIHTITVNSDIALNELLLVSDLNSKKINAFRATQENQKWLIQMRLGSEWPKYGLYSLPKPTNVLALGVNLHMILWLHNLIVCFGLYEFCKDEYKKLEANDHLWKSQKHITTGSFVEKMSNCGRSYQQGIDFVTALSYHPNPTLVKVKLEECHLWLNKRAKLSNNNRIKYGLNIASDFGYWNEQEKDILRDEAAALKSLFVTYKQVLLEEEEKCSVIQEEKIATIKEHDPNVPEKEERKLCIKINGENVSAKNSTNLFECTTTNSGDNEEDLLNKPSIIFV